MDFSHFRPDLPLGEKKDLGDGKVIYSFKKSQHVRLLLRNLAEMQAKGVQTDLIVQTKSEDLEEPFHSELLAACSPSMKQALAGTNYDLTGAISFGHITANELKAFRDFLYKPETILDEEIVADLEQFAKKYRVHSLAQLCGQRKHQREGAEGMAVWAKHYEDLLAQLYEMFQKRELTKAILKGDEESCEIQVHGPLIGAASPVFRDMFSNELFCQEGQKYRLRGISSKTLNCLLRYIYTGEVTVDGATVQDLLQNSCTYKIPAIISACCDWLSSTMSAYNAIGIWHLSRETESEDTNNLEREAKAFIVENFAKICEEDDEYYDLECEDLKEILQDDNLGVDCEEDVFNAVETWVGADKEVRSRYFCDLFKCVRLANTNVKFLRDLETHPLVQDYAICLQAVRRALAEIVAQEPIDQALQDGGFREDNYVTANVPQYGFDEGDVRWLIEGLTHCEDETYNTGDCYEELPKQNPPRGLTEKGKTDMRLKSNRQEVGCSNKSPLKSASKEKATLNPQETEVPLKKDGTPDRRFKVNRNTLKTRSQGNTVEEKETLQAKEVPLKKDGTPDRRFKVNRNTLKSRSQGNTVEEKATSQERDVPLKKDGTPDRRFKVNKNTLKSRSQGNAVEEIVTSDMREYGIPRKKDGTPDMRFKVNKTASGSSSSSCTGRSSSGESIGPLKSDGTPDMRYAVNKAACSSPSSSNTSGYRAYDSGMPASGSSRRGSSSPGPLKSDGTPDMRYAVNKATYSSPVSSSYQPYSSEMAASGSSRRGSSSPGPLKSDGTPDMRYAVNKATYSSPVSSCYQPYSSEMSASGSSRRGSSSPGPLKSDGTPDMRYAINKAAFSNPFSFNTSGYGSYSSGMFSSGSSLGGSSSPGPLKSDGTPDMRYAVNKAAYSSQMSRRSSGYSSGSSYYSLEGYSSPVSRSSASFASGSLSSGCGPLKKDGTPDMRFKANRW